MKVSDYIIDFLVKEKVTHVFEVCGGALAHILDSLYGRSDIKTISVHHEQAAAIAAEGFARVKGDIGVALATSGPGATNLLTGIASCFFDSIPSVYITGQVNLNEFKHQRPVRQIGFQETDIVEIARPIVKDAIFVTNPQKIRYALEKAFFLARSGRPGPVLLDIPMDIQRSECSSNKMEPYRPARKEKATSGILKKDIKRIVAKLNRASKPVILVGGGVILSHAQKALSNFISRHKIPVVSSLLGLDCLKNRNDFVGMIGTYGNRYANLTVANSDFLLCLGTRLDTRQTGTMPLTFAKKAFKIHVDIDPHELNNKVKVDVAIRADIKDFLSALEKQDIRLSSDKLFRWKKKINSLRNSYPSFLKSDHKPIDPNFFIHQVSRFLSPHCVITADIGQNQIWTAQSLALKASQRFLTQGGMGTMGSSLPMAIGACFARAKKTVVAIMGDGGFQLNIQELQTIIHHRLPIKIILLNNFCYGMVRQFQQQYFNSRYQSTLLGYSCPNFQKVVSAYGIPVYKLDKNAQTLNTLKSFFSLKGPAFLEVIIPQNTLVLPKLSVNKPIEEQDPALSLEELKSFFT